VISHGKAGLPTTDDKGVHSLAADWVGHFGFLLGELLLRSLYSNLE
jgi:hypothetical protein